MSGNALIFFDGKQIQPWPEDPDVFVCSRQVAFKLGYRSMRTYWSDKQWLEKNQFPKPPLKRRWRARAIEAWLAWREAGSIQPANDPAPCKPNQPCGQLSARERLDKLRVTKAS